MPWYAWLILIIALGSIIGGLLLLRDTAKKLPLTDEQLKKSTSVMQKWTRRTLKTAKDADTGA